MKSVILACSGPSLNLVDFYAPGFPICAVSTAINSVPDPAFWVFLDRLKIDFGADNGVTAAQNPRIVKVTQHKHYRALNRHPSVVFVTYNSRADDRERSFLDGKPGYIRGPHLSMSLAMQYLCANGYRRIIIAGCDLNTNPREPYAHLPTRKVKNEGQAIARAGEQNKNHENMLNTLRTWHPIAQKKGIEWVSWTPNSPINEFLPRYEP